MNAIEIKLQRLRDEKTALLETSEDHRRVLSTIRNVPEDVLREICTACVHYDTTLSYRTIPLLYRLAQISRGMRHIMLTTPSMWARMDIQVQFGSLRMNEAAYSLLADKASEWFERAGGLPLTLFIRDTSRGTYGITEDSASLRSRILLDTLLGYSVRWKEISFKSGCDDITTPLIRIAGLKATDLPPLESVNLDLDWLFLPSTLSISGILTIPMLKRVSFTANSNHSFTVNWPVLTSISLRAKWHPHHYTRHELTLILQQTTRLIFCDIAVSLAQVHDGNHPQKISLPFLETLYIDERAFGPPSSTAPSLLDCIIAPTLAEFRINGTFPYLSLSKFLQRSPKIGRFRSHTCRKTYR